MPIIAKEFKISNKTLPREYNIAKKEVQKQYCLVFNGGKTEDIKNALAYIENLPILNTKPIRVRNKKGQMIALVGAKGAVQFFNTDYCNKTWYFDGNKLGKRKRLLAEAFNNDEIANSINTDGIDRVWKKISYRMSY